MTICSTERPWGIHPALRSDENCPRCGWTAPGPKGDAHADALEMAQAHGQAASFGWTFRSGDPAGAFAA